MLFFFSGVACLIWKECQNHCWANILNYEERYKAAKSPSRLFSTQIMLKENEYELVFVPIIWEKHFYVVCFNLKHYIVEVLDNNAVEDKLNIKDKYDGWEEKLVSILKTLYVETMLSKRHTNICKNVKLQHDAFANYLRIKNTQMAKIMKSAPVVRQKMDWRTTSNVFDCQKFAMRHMETYMGQVAGWDVV
ncbi:hypothetical protein Hanom_Chr13g01237141 [Helianthus anomalus]